MSKTVEQCNNSEESATEHNRQILENLNGTCSKCGNWIGIVWEETTPSPDVAGSDAVVAKWERITESNQPDELTNYLWCKAPITEPPYVGTVNDEGFPNNYYTHFMRLPNEFFPDPRNNAGAAFQAAQGVGDGFNDKVIGKTIKDLPDAYTWDDLFEIGKGVPSGTQHFFRNYFDLPVRKGAAPAAVSAGTWVKVGQRLPKTNGGVYLRNAPELFASVELDRDGKSVALCVYNQEDDEMVYTNSHPDINTCNWEWLDESTSGLPDVRELVEALEKIVDKYYEPTTDVQFTMKQIGSIAQTALAGFKRK